jgi:hypothetical protein
MTLAADVTLTINNGDGTATVWTHVRSIGWVVNTAKQFNDTGQGIRASIRVLAEVEGKDAGDVVELEQDDWRLLHEAFEAPAQGFCPPLEQKIPGRMFLTYIDALSDEATKSKPKPKAEATNGVSADVEAAPAPS